MRHFAFALPGAVIALGFIVSCTQNFDQFEPAGGVTSSGVTTTTGAGNAGGMGGNGGIGGASTSAGGTGGTGGVIGEDCLNGVDDDGNGDADCQDSACTIVECVSPPNGWSGPSMLFEGNTGQVPNCPQDVPTEQYSGFNNPAQTPATCNACTCGAANTTCTPAPVDMYEDLACTGVDDSANQTNMCNSLNIAGGLQIVAYRIAAPQVNAGTCTAGGGGVANTPMPTWLGEGRVCGDPISTGCGMGQECVPTSPQSGLVCVWRSGDQGCPNGFPDKHLFATTFNDTRNCSNCSCGNAMNAACTATTTIFSNSGCSGTMLATVPNNDTCTAGAEGTSAEVTTTITNGTCAPAGGMATGSVDLAANTRTTVCCR